MPRHHHNAAGYIFKTKRCFESLNWYDWWQRWHCSCLSSWALKILFVLGVCVCNQMSLAVREESSFSPVECTSSKSVLPTTNVPAPKRPPQKRKEKRNKPEFCEERKKINKKKSGPSGVFPLTLPLCTCTESLKSSMCLSTQWRQCIASGASLQLRATSLQRTGGENCQH